MPLFPGARFDAAERAALETTYNHAFRDLRSAHDAEAQFGVFMPALPPSIRAAAPSEPRVEKAARCSGSEALARRSL